MPSSHETEAAQRADTEPDKDELATELARLEGSPDAGVR
jgi:hypothetical protein